MPLTDPPDRLYLDLENAVDRGRGRLRVVRGALCAHFCGEEIKPLYTEIEKVLNLSFPRQADFREVDAVVERACDLIPDIIRRYR
jgi:hypothetical protein